MIRIPLVLLLAATAGPIPRARAEMVAPASPAAPVVYAPAVLAGLSPGDLARVADEFEQLRNSVLEILRRSHNDSIRYEIVRKVGRYHTREAQALLFEVIRSELKRVDESAMGADPRLLSETVRTLADFGSFGPTRPSELALDFADLVAEARGRLRKHVYGHILPVELDDLGAALEARRERLVDLGKLLESRGGTGRSGPAQKLKFARDYVREHVVGQEEVIERIFAKLWSNLVDAGPEARPNVFVLMGPKGFGHGTIAKNFVRGLHAYPTADKLHFFQMPVIRDHDDLWTSMGSAVGYHGSESGVPRLVQWLVDHSGGRYEIETEKGQLGGVRFRVVETPDWSPDRAKPGQSPRDAVLFIKDFQNWSKTYKDQFLLPALTEGYFKINNPNDGEAGLHVPVNIVVETTDGASLLTGKEANGERVGKPLDFHQILARYRDRRDDRAAIESAFHEANDGRLRGGGAKAPGNSDELVATLLKSGPLLLAPPHAEERFAMTEQHLAALAHRLDGASQGPLGRARLTWTPELARFVSDYGVWPEDGALGLSDRIDELVRAPLAKLVEHDRIRPSGTSVEIELGLRANPDRTHALRVRWRSGAEDWREADSPMLPTRRDRPATEITDARIAEIKEMGPRLKGKVFGIDPIVDRLTARALTIENSGDLALPANVILMDGLSSTGKTQTAKEFAAELLRDADDLVTFDFSRIQTLRAFEEEISGWRDADGRAIKSKFMKAFDRADGRLVVAFDELANVRDPALLKILYDILRESTVRTFADGKPRKMTGVTIIITGNATENLYTRVPSHLPVEVQMRAFEQIAERVGLDFALQRGELAKTYPEAFMNRVQSGNTFLMAPHTWKTLRQLAQLKIRVALEHLRSTAGRRGWDVAFASAADYDALVDTVIDEGFRLREQGASIEKYVDQEFRVGLENLLLTHMVPSGTRVVLGRGGQTANDDRLLRGRVEFRVDVAGSTEPKRLDLPRTYRKTPLEKDPHILLKTAFHEAGHSLVSFVSAPGAYVPLSLSVIEGLTVINNEFVHYAGLWDSEPRIDVSITRAHVVREIAMLLGGETAERLVLRGGAHGAGKANDIERAATLAQNAILRFGLSSRWGLDAIPASETIEQFVAKLPERDKKVLRREMKALIAEGRRLAREIIEANFEAVFLPLGLELAQAGQLEGPRIREFFETHRPVDARARTIASSARDRARSLWRRWRNPALATLSPQILAEIEMPARLADVERIAEERKRALYAEVPRPDDVPLATCEPSLAGARP